jgi:hypothetical protein
MGANAVLAQSTVKGTVTGGDDSSAVNGATVVLYKKVGSGSGWDKEKVAGTTTGSDGAYEFTNVDTAEKYLVFAVADSLAPTVNKWIEELTSGQVVTADIHLPVPEHGFAAINGTVTNQSSAAIENATIVLMGKAEKGGATLYEITAASTNASGEYLFSTIPVLEEAKLIASASGYETDSSSDFTLSADTTVTVNFILREGVTGIFTQNDKNDLHSIVTYKKIGENLFMHFEGINSPAQITLFSVDGRMLMQATVKSSKKDVILPMRNGGKVLIASIRGEDKLITRKILLP